MNVSTKRVRTGEDRLAQIRRSRELRAIHHDAGGVDRQAAIERAPLADVVVVLERKPDRIHHVVAGRADLVGPVIGEARAQRGRLGGRGIEIVLDARRWWRRRNAEHVLQNPCAANHRRCAVRDRGDRENGALPQQPTSRTFLRQADLAELIADHAIDAVVTRESLVEERVVRVQQLENIAVLVHDAGEHESRFLLEGLTQVVVEFTTFRLRAGELPQVQPLSCEVVDERAGPRIGQHPPHLTLELARLAQAFFNGGLQQLFVGNAAPDEERQTRREVEIVDAEWLSWLGRLRLALEAIEKARIHQDVGECLLHARLEAALFMTRFVEAHDARHVLAVWREWCAKCALGETRNVLPRTPRLGLPACSGDRRKSSRGSPSGPRRLVQKGPFTTTLKIAPCAGRSNTDRSRPPRSSDRRVLP